MQRNRAFVSLTLILALVVALFGIFHYAGMIFVKVVQADKSLIDNELLENPENEKFARLAEKAAQVGSVRIIVGLRDTDSLFNFQPEGDLEKSASKAQRASIRRMSDAFIAKTAGFQTSDIKQFRYIPYLAMKVDANTLHFIKEMPEVKSLDEDLISAPNLSESVPLVSAPQAWTAGFTGLGQTVAVLDTGVDKNHDFLAGKVVSEACYSTTDPFVSRSLCPNGASSSTAAGSGLHCATSIGNCVHGTHVAGIVAGKNNSANFYGVAKDASIISIQVYSEFESYFCGGNTSCALSFTSDQMLGLERVYALRNTRRIAAVNLSLGEGQYTSNCDDNPLKATVDNLRSVGIATIISSGNNGYANALNNPACISTTISVGSSIDTGTSVNNASGFSNRASFLSLYAPGQTITSSYPGNTYGSLNGTSMAAPHIAGAWAILKQKSPGASVNEISNVLASTGVPVTMNGITKSRIKIDAALNALSSPTAATVSIGGKVQTANGENIYKARVTLLDTSNGETYTATTNPFGNFSIAEIPVGETYILSVNHKLYRFEPQSLTLLQANNEMNIVALP